MNTDNVSNLKSLYLFYGPEKFLLEESIKKIKKSFGELKKGINYIEIGENNILDIISNLETPPFGFEKKLIIVKNSGLFKKDSKSGNITTNRNKIEEYLSNNFDYVKDYNVLIFIEEDALKNLNLYKFIQKKGIVQEFVFLKPIQIKDRLKKIALAYKVNISDQNLMYFIDLVGTNMQDLINEIRKLIEYAGPGGEIKKEDIDCLTIKQMQAIIFDFTDNIGTKNIAKALEILDTLVYNKEPYQKILITVYNHFKKLYLLKLYENLNNSNISIEEVLNLKPNQMFLISKYKKQAYYFKEDELKNIIEELSDLDYKSKNGIVDIEVGFKTILCKNS